MIFILIYISFDLQDFHRLTDELTQQKEELQKQISLQAEEMESLTQEIQEQKLEGEFWPKLITSLELMGNLSGILQETSKVNGLRM